MKNINEIVEKLKMQDELLTQKEINVIINQKPAASRRRFKPYLAIILAGIVLFSLIGVVINNIETDKQLNHSKEKNIENQSIKLATTIKSNKEPSVFKVKKNEQQVNKRTETIEKGKTKQVGIANTVTGLIAKENIKINQLKTNKHFKEDAGSSGLDGLVLNHSNEGGVTGIPIPKTLINKRPIGEKAIVLTNKELEKFNIYLYDDVFLYSITDQNSNSSFEAYLTTEGNSVFNKVFFCRKPAFLKHHPKYILTERSVYYNFKKDDINEVEEKKYLPILIPFITKHSARVLCYFDQNKENIGKLPDRYKNNYKEYSIKPTTFITKKVKLETKKKEQKEKYRKPYFKGQTIVADKQLITNLGIIDNVNEIKYKKKSNIKVDITKESLSTASEFKKINNFSDKYQKNTPPSFILTNTSHYAKVLEVASKNTRKADSEKYFYSNVYSMTGVMVYKSDSTEIIFWYKNTLRLDELLNKDQKEQLAQFSKIHSVLNMPKVEISSKTRKLNITKMKEYKNLKTLVINPLKLNNTDLNKLNIAVIDDKVHFTINAKNGLNMVISFNKKHSITSFAASNGSKNPNILPTFISDKYGKSYKMTISDSDEDSLINLEQLIPVYVHVNQEYHLSDYLKNFSHPDCIFWYKPSKAFMDVLPNDVRKQLKFEITAINNTLLNNTPKLDVKQNKDTMSNNQTCVYLNPCSDIKMSINKVKIFPNPNMGLFTINFSVDKDVYGEVHIKTLSGQILKTYKYKSMKEEKSIDISSLSAGIYLVEVTSKNGDYFIRRVVKK